MSSKRSLTPRSLAPAPPPGIGRDTAEASTVPHQAKKVSRACAACRSRKIKCTGTVPCDNCVKNNVSCLIDKNDDGRRSLAIKRKIDSLEDDRELLLRLVETLRTSEEADVFQLLSLVRSHASFDELKAYLNDQLEKEDSAELAALCSKVDQLQEEQAICKIPRRVLDAKRLSDQPVFCVPARPWTTVTDDDALVSHLISLYFTWYHPSFPYLDRELFLRDMQRGNIDCQCCSPFLVNTVLADACAYSDYDEAFQDPKDPSTRGAHFFAEAKRCYETEEGRITLATVQGLETLSACSFLTGKSRRGWIHQGQLDLAAKEISSRNPSASNAATDDSLELGRATDFTLWGLYISTMASAMAQHRLPAVHMPRRRPRPHPAPDHKSEGTPWIPYPPQGDAIQSHFGCHFHSLCDLTQIINDWCLLLFDGDRKPDPTQVRDMTESVYKQLLEWKRQLPSCLGMDPEKSILPHVLSLHMYYHNILITVFGFAKTSAAAETAGDDADQYTHHTSSPSVPDKHAATNVCLSSAREVARLMNLHRSSWGLNIFPACHIQWITASLFTLLEHLDDASNQEPFVSLAVAVKASSRRWVLGKEMLRTVQTTAQQMEITLPAETDPLFVDF